MGAFTFRSVMANHYRIYRKRCVICGSEYVSKSPASKTCSDKCRRIKDKIRRHKWYLSDRDRILAQQKEYRARKKEETIDEKGTGKPQK